jgi:hypothetical protein
MFTSRRRTHLDGVDEVHRLDVPGANFSVALEEQGPQHLLLDSLAGRARRHLVRRHLVAAHVLKQHFELPIIKMLILAQFLKQISP